MGPLSPIPQTVGMESCFSWDRACTHYDTLCSLTYLVQIRSVRRTLEGFSDVHDTHLVLWQGFSMKPGCIALFFFLSQR
jgi:hypothetical protein